MVNLIMEMALNELDRRKGFRQSTPKFQEKGFVDVNTNII